MEKSAGAVTCEYPQRGYKVSGEVLVEAVAVVGVFAGAGVRRLVSEL